MNVPQILASTTCPVWMTLTATLASVQMHFKVTPVKRGNTYCIYSNQVYHINGLIA